MKQLRSGWCETGHCSRCPELLQVANNRRREIHCDCRCHKMRSNSEVAADWVARTRAEQGLPDEIENPATLRRLAGLLLGRA